MQKYTIRDFDRDFPTDDACLGRLKQLRWPNGIPCSKCDRITLHHKISNRPGYVCDSCGTHVYPMSGTILEHSSTPLRLWFYAMYLMGSTRTGISAKQLQRELGVTYKTAWRMFTQIRKVMTENGIALFGAIEVDETYIGGKRPGKRGRGAAGKTIAVGMVERDGKAIVLVAPDVKARTLLPIIQEHIPIADGTTIYTDGLPSYNRLSSLGYAHETVQHRAKQYVAGNAHTNNIEGIWSNTKRGIDGVHHAISPKYTQGYLDSDIFRYNHRNDETPMFLQILGQVAN